MYPITAWTYSQLCERLQQLEDLSLYPELVVVYSQLIEQIIKRHLAREINIQRQYWDKTHHRWADLEGTRQRDEVLHSWQGPDDWKRAWRKLLHEQRGHLPLVRAFEQVVGAEAWTILIKNSALPKLPTQAPSDPPLRYGLRPCRHKVVHGMHSPPRREMEWLGSWGATAVQRLLHPQCGWPAMLGWNAGYP
jgi:hypothetical protein